MSVTEKNPRALKDLVKRLQQGVVIKVGIQGAQASKDHDGITVADIGAIHEFGLGNNPVRSWLRAWFDENENVLREDLRRGYRKVIQGAINPETLAEALGLKMVASIQTRITNGIPPALSPETIARKESSVPLIDTGVFKSSITFVLESGNMVGGFIP